MSTVVKLSMNDDFSKFYKKDMFGDVQIHVNDTVFKCSSIILAQQSKVFEEMLANGEKDILLDEFLYEGSEVGIDDCLTFVYGGKVELNVRNILIVSKFSLTYKIEAMFDLCKKWVYCYTNIENLLTVIKIADLQSDYRENSNFLRKFCYTFIEDNMLAVIAIMLEVEDKETLFGLMKMLFILSDPRSCDFILHWTALSEANKRFVLQHVDDVSFSRIYPDIVKFRKFVETLESNTTSAETLKAIVLIQQKYYSALLADKTPKPAKYLPPPPEAETKDDAPVQPNFKELLSMPFQDQKLLRYHPSLNEYQFTEIIASRVGMGRVEFWDLIRIYNVDYDYVEDIIEFYIRSFDIRLPSKTTWPRTTTSLTMMLKEEQILSLHGDGFIKDVDRFNYCPSIGCKIKSPHCIQIKLDKEPPLFTAREVELENGHVHPEFILHCYGIVYQGASVESGMFVSTVIQNKDQFIAELRDGNECLLRLIRKQVV